MWLLSPTVQQRRQKLSLQTVQRPALLLEGNAGGIGQQIAGVLTNQVLVRPAGRLQAGIEGEFEPDPA